MARIRSIHLLIAFGAAVVAYCPIKHEHHAVDVKRRGVGPPVMGPPPEVTVRTTSTPSPLSTITVITPSPGASPVPVTSQSQLVTSYYPLFTLCELPPTEAFPVTFAPSAKSSTAPWQNVSVSAWPGNGTCTTIFSETQTMVCDTILTDLTTTRVVTNCAQEITFSTQYGYTLLTPMPTGNASINGTSLAPNGTFSSVTAVITPAPEIVTLTTYYMAPWQSLTAGTAPSDVVKEVCQTYSNDTEECITEYQVWHTSLITSTATETSSLNISTTVHGSNGIIVWDTIVANVTEQLTTFSMLTTMENEYETHWTTTQQTTATISTAPTVYETMTLEEATSTATSVVSSPVTTNSTLTALQT